jgi:hypothetical protein
VAVDLAITVREHVFRFCMQHIIHRYNKQAAALALRVRSFLSLTHTTPWKTSFPAYMVIYITHLSQS